MIRAAIFDLDGTVLDSMNLWKTAGEEILESLGVAHEENLGARLFKMTFDESAQYLKKNYLPKFSTEEIISHIKFRLKDAYEKEIPLKSGAKNFLTRLKKSGAKTALCTNNSKTLFVPALKRFGIEDAFDAVVTTEETGLSKEKPEIFLRAAELIQAKTAETWVFDDSLYAIQTAKKCGFKTAGVFDSESEQDSDAVKANSDIYIFDFSSSLLEEI